MKHEIQKGFAAMGPSPDRKEKMMRSIEEKQGNSGGGYAARAHRSSAGAIAAAVAVLVLTIAGAGILAGRSNGAMSSSSETLIQSDPVQATAPDVEPILDKYRQALAQNWDRDACEAAGISYMVSFLHSIDPLGYHLSDLDGDGTWELIISDGNVIYDLYCIDGQQVTKVITGAERNAYVLCTNGCIRNIASNSAADTCYSFYEYRGCRLHLREKVQFSDCREADGHHHSQGNHHGNGQHVHHNNRECTQEQAWQIIDGYESAQIPLTPIG